MGIVVGTMVEVIGEVSKEMETEIVEVLEMDQNHRS